MSKNILIDAGYDYPGHTELFAELERHARVPHDADRR